MFPGMYLGGMMPLFGLLHVGIVAAFLYFAYDIAKSLRRIANKLDNDELKEK